VDRICFYGSVILLYFTHEVKAFLLDKHPAQAYIAGTAMGILSLAAIVSLLACFFYSGKRL
jgi:hypothetical protein